MRLTFVTAVFLLASRGASANYLQPRQGFVSSLLDAFGPPGDDDDNTTTKTKPSPKPSKTEPPQTTSKKATVTTTRAEPTTKSTLNPKPTSTSESSDTSTATDTSTITSSATLTETTATSTNTPSTSIAAPINPQPTATPVRSGGISPAGIAVAVIFSIVIVLIIAWLMFRYHPKCRAWWDARQEEKYKKRSYRDALDGPDAGANGGGLTRGRVGLQSFFQPKVARSQSKVEGIKRKTIHWGVPSPKVGSRDIENGTQQNRDYDHGMEVVYNKNGGAVHKGYASGEKVPLAELASPMGINREPPRAYEVSPMLKSTIPHSPTMSPVSPVSGGRKSFGALSSVAGSINTTRTNSTQPPSIPPSNRVSKALPQVKVNGQVVYELA